jgi:hypothetical protein
MSFRDQLLVDSKHIIRVACQVGTFLDGLSASDRAEVVEALDDPELTGAAIARGILDRWKTRVPIGVVQRHRRRTYGAGCKCE